MAAAYSTTGQSRRHNSLQLLIEIKCKPRTIYQRKYLSQVYTFKKKKKQNEGRSEKKKWCTKKINVNQQWPYKIIINIIYGIEDTMIE